MIDMKRTIITKECGISLVELLIVLALLSIVLALGYNIFFFGYNVFERGETLSIIQNNSRSAASVITRSTRNSVTIGIYSDFEGLDTSGNMIYLDQADRIIYHKLNNTVVYSTEPYMESIEFVLVEDNDRYVLEFEVVSEKDGRTHDLLTRVLLNNITESSIDVESEPSGHILLFTRP